MAHDNPLKPEHATAGRARPVASNQAGLHPGLFDIVQRRLGATHREPIRAHNRYAYDKLQAAQARRPAPLILDSFCGSGHSTVTLAHRHPEHLVVGIDKSAHRLARQPGDPPHNCLLLRADCEQIWMQLARDGMRLAAHFLLYPNPWPKSRHLRRRVHGHPAFPCLLALGGSLELRSNWQLYVEEFGAAVRAAGHYGIVSRLPPAETALTLFEKKYRASGHALWRFRCTIAP